MKLNRTTSKLIRRLVVDNLSVLAILYKSAFYTLGHEHETAWIFLSSSNPTSSLFDLLLLLSLLYYFITVWLMMLSLVEN